MLNNKLIVESPVILFLGAGASAPLGKPMMAEFVAKAAKRIQDQAQQSMVDLLRRFRGDDLEGILGELDTIIDRDYAQAVPAFLRDLVKLGGCSNPRASAVLIMR